MSSTTTSATAAATAAFLDAYEPLDVIGNGSFGIIRKVRRKSDGLIFARKELNFERMSERDRKQIVAEVNILKDLHHSHIVRYHDRFVDRDAGILYILMEYCGGGDLSAVIKHAARAGRPIPEDTIWHYFYQILHALFHCHHPNSHGRSGSGGSPVELQAGAAGGGAGGGGAPPAHGRRPQILHRDLKPDNVFLDENNTVKLGDFGLSKALAQASFANTYVGTPYYMSPELMQEKAYDSKSDIWSLGCLIYELCALKPPFHEAKTHSELSIFIRNGRIPPLPRGYSQALTSVIKSMLNLNPAMRPSAAQLLQHERLELVSRVAEAEKMLATVKSHRAIVAAKEREVVAREHSIQETQQHLTSIVAQKDREIANLQHLVSQLQTQVASSSASAAAASTPPAPAPTTTTSPEDIARAVKAAVSARESELRALVMAREAEVAQAIARREEEIMDAVRTREAEVDAACRAREDAVRVQAEGWMREFGERRREVEERGREVEEREREVEAWARRVEEREREVEEREEGVRRREEALVAGAAPTGSGTGRIGGLLKGRLNKNPLEEVKNTFDPSTRAASGQVTPLQARKARAINGPIASIPSLKLHQTDAQPPATPRTSNTLNAAASNTNTSSTTNNNTTATSSTHPNPTVLSTPLPASRLANTNTHTNISTPANPSTPSSHIPSPSHPPFSAMKGVVLTATGETLATPSPAELVSLFERSPKVGLNFGRIFDLKGGAGESAAGGVAGSGSGEKLNADLRAAAAGAGLGDVHSPPPSPSVRKREGKDREREQRDRERDEDETSSVSSGSTHTSQHSQHSQGRLSRRSTSRQSAQQQQQSTHAQAQQPPPTRIRCPSIRTTSATSGVPKVASTALPHPHPHMKSRSASSVPQQDQHHQHQQQHHQQQQTMKPLPHPHLRPSTSATNLRQAPSSSSHASHASHVSSSATVSFPMLPIPVPRTHPSPEYDFADEENLPSPFLKRVDKHAMAKAKAVAAAASSSSHLGAALAGGECTTSGGVSSSGASSSSSAPSSSATAAAKTKRRGSSGLLLRAVAAANSAGRRTAGPSSALSDGGAGEQQDDGAGEPYGPGDGASHNPLYDGGARPSLGARKALSRA